MRGNMTTSHHVLATCEAQVQTRHMYVTAFNPDYDPVRSRYCYCSRCTDEDTPVRMDVGNNLLVTGSPDAWSPRSCPCPSHSLPPEPGVPRRGAFLGVPTVVFPLLGTSLVQRKLPFPREGGLRCSSRAESLGPTQTARVQEGRRGQQGVRPCAGVSRSWEQALGLLP